MCVVLYAVVLQWVLVGSVRGEFSLEWSTKSVENYAVMKPITRDLTEFTILFTANMDANNEIHSGVLSYGLDDEGIRIHFNTVSNEMVVKVMETSTKCKASQCLVHEWLTGVVTWTSEEGHLNVYLNGVRLLCSLHRVSAGQVIKPALEGPTLGEYNIGPGLSTIYSRFVGELTQVNIYPEYLATDTAVLAMLRNNVEKAVSGWNEAEIQLYGDVKRITLSKGHRHTNEEDLDCTTIRRLFREKQCYVIMEKREETEQERIEREQRMQAEKLEDESRRVKKAKEKIRVNMEREKEEKELEEEKREENEGKINI